MRTVAAGRSVSRLPITLWPGMKCGQLVCLRMSSAVLAGYGAAGRSSRYQGQVGPTASRSHLEEACGFHNSPLVLARKCVAAGCAS